MNLNGLSVRAIAVTLVNMDIRTFTRAAYDADYDAVSEARRAYFKEKYDRFDKNPCKAICYLDVDNLDNLAKWLNANARN